MSDLEGLTRHLLQKGYNDEDIIERLIQSYQDFKEINKSQAFKYAKAILEECKVSEVKTIKNTYIKELLNINNANVSVGKQGVGCGGAGDFFVHKLIAELSETNKKPFLAPKSLDDAGAVKLSNITGFKGKTFSHKDLIIVSKMEGIHSRLHVLRFGIY